MWGRREGGEEERERHILMGSVKPQLSRSICVLALKPKNMYVHVRIASLFKDQPNVSLFLSLPPSITLYWLTQYTQYLSLSLLPSLTLLATQ